MKLTLKNGRDYSIREIELKDAEPMLSFLESVAAESDNLTFGPGEFRPSVKEEEEFIKSCREKGNCCAFVAASEGRIIGNLSFRGGERSRTSHAGEFGVSVLKEFWGNGIATALMNRMLDWAATAPVTKINLKVKDDNDAAIDLYRKLGFEVEGRLTRDFRINGKYYDSVLMGKIID